LAWAVDLGVQITDEGRSLYIASFSPEYHLVIEHVFGISM
jgi:hypothetical protein